MRDLRTTLMLLTRQANLGRSGVVAPQRRGSVLVIVMVTLLFATFALLAFLEKASVDLLVDQREAVTRRLRMEAYSALETTLAVLENFRAVGDGLRSPSEGWGDPLAFAGYEPSEGRTVEITFEDESGKISLPRANVVVLTNLFESWGILKHDSESLADAMLGWMKRDHVYASAVVPSYEHGTLPYEAPGRSLRSYHELAAIEKVRDFFYDTDGRPNEYWRRFVDTVSLLRFERPNINGAKTDTLAALGQFDESGQRTIDEYRRGDGSYLSKGPGYFRSPTDVREIAGPAGDAGAFSTTISALRIFVTVRDGRSEFRMAAVISPPNGATPVQETATRRVATASSALTSSQQQNRPNAAQAAPTTGARGSQSQQQQQQQSLKYPFSLLEIRENDQIPTAPAGVAAL